MENKKITLDELKKAAEPLVELLRKKGHPHMTVIVTGRWIKLVEDITGIPMPYDDESEDALIDFLMSKSFYEVEK